MGFKDGTANIKAEDPAALREFVWVGDERRARPWMRDGTCLVTRRIRMLIEAWDRAPLAEQEETIGRHKASGAPLGASDEFDRDRSRRTCRPTATCGWRAAGERRPGSSAAATRTRTGSTPSSASSTPASSSSPTCAIRPAFVALQRRLGAADKLNEYISTSARASGRSRPGRGAAAGWAPRCSARTRADHSGRRGAALQRSARRKRCTSPARWKPSRAYRCCAGPSASVKRKVASVVGLGGGARHGGVGEPAAALGRGGDDELDLGRVRRDHEQAHGRGAPALVARAERPCPRHARTLALPPQVRLGHRLGGRRLEAQPLLAQRPRPRRA